MQTIATMQLPEQYAVTWTRSENNGKHAHTVQYGKQIKHFSGWLEAFEEFHQCSTHSAECAGMMDDHIDYR